MKYAMYGFAIVLTLALLAGCKLDAVDGDGCTVEKQTTADQTMPSGLVLQASSGMFLTADQIEQAYIETQQCTGIAPSGRPPTVAFRSFDFYGLSGLLGFFMPVDALVWINTDPVPGSNEPTDCKLQRQVLKHELVHYLLNDAGTPDQFHASPLFQQCGRVVIGYDPAT